MQDYNNKIIEFTHANTNAAFDFVQRMSGVKSPSEFVEPQRLPIPSSGV
jgi:hypothetical protein